MKRNSLLAVLILITLAAGAYAIYRGTSKELPVANQPQQVTNTAQNPSDSLTPQDNPASSQGNDSNGTAQQNDSIPADWKTYTNEELGFSFRYPSTWTKYGEDRRINDRSTGNLKKVMINFIDTTSPNTTLLIEYHLPPKGFERYEYAVFQYKSSQDWYEPGTEGIEGARNYETWAKEIEVAGNKAIEIFTTMIMSGKEYIPRETPLRYIRVAFLDKQKNGAIELQFNTPLANDAAEVAKFNHILLSIQFIN